MVTVVQRRQEIVRRHVSDHTGVQAETFKYPPYSPHLAPGDYHLFMHHNTFLAGQSPKSDQATKDIAHYILKGSASSILDEGTQKLVS